MSELGPQVHHRIHQWEIKINVYLSDTVHTSTDVYYTSTDVRYYTHNSTNITVTSSAAYSRGAVASPNFKSMAVGFPKSSDVLL